MDQFPGKRAVVAGDYRSLYLSYLRYCNEHDFDGMASFYTSTIKVNDVPMHPAAVTDQFDPIVSAFPDWHWEIRHLVVDSDNVAVHFTVTGTHRGVFQGIEPTGRRVTTSEFTLYRVEDGKFAEVWDLTDMDAVMRQIS
jgi:predicted ester cyclase